MDTDTAAYDMTKQAFYDDRILAPDASEGAERAVHLEFDAKNQMIDHPPQGSKDVSDSMAGVAFGLTMRREIWLRHQVPLTRIPASLHAAAGKNSIAAQARRRTSRTWTWCARRAASRPAGEARCLELIASGSDTNLQLFCDDLQERKVNYVVVGDAVCIDEDVEELADLAEGRAGTCLTRAARPGSTASLT